MLIHDSDNKVNSLKHEIKVIKLFCLAGGSTGKESILNT